MAIIRIPYPEPLPLYSSDYVKQNNLIEQLFLCTYRPVEIVSGNIQRGAVIQCGGTVYYADADTAITGTPSDYVKLTPSGDGSSLSASYVANLTGVSWNQAYNGYYDVSGNLYIFNEAIALGNGEISAVKTKYLQQDQNGDVSIGNDLKVYGSIYDKNGTEVLGMLVETKIDEDTIGANTTADYDVEGFSWDPTAVLDCAIVSWPSAGSEHDATGDSLYGTNNTAVCTIIKVTLGTNKVTVRVGNAAAAARTIKIICTACYTA
jgi:hypothetical protein